MKKFASPLFLMLSLLSLTLNGCQTPDISISVNSEEAKTTTSSTPNLKPVTTEPKATPLRKPYKTRQASAQAAPQRNEQRFNRPSELISQDPQSRINVRSQPSTSSTALHYGFSGDKVTLLKSSPASDGVWYYLEFTQSKAKGWVRQDFVNLSYRAELYENSNTHFQESSEEYYGDLPQSAELYRKNPNEKINVYNSSSFSSAVNHYGLSTDKVTILDIVLEEDGHWSYIRFDQSGAEGWVHDSDFLPL